MAHEHDGAVDGRFAELMARLAAPFDKRLTEALIRSYARALGDLPFEAVVEAAQRAVLESVWFPSIALLRGYAVGTPEDAAVLAWMHLRLAASAVGAYSEMQCENGLVAEALEQVFGGWPQFCEQCDESYGGWGIKRQEFLAAYRTARAGHHDVPTPRTLPGLCGNTEGLTWRGGLKANGEVVHGVCVMPIGGDLVAFVTRETSQ